MDLEHQLDAYRREAAALARLKRVSRSFASPPTVRAMNQIADSLRQRAGAMGRGGQPGVQAFANLMDEGKDDVCYLAAFHVLEFTSASGEAVEKAFGLLEGRDSVDARGTGARLEELRTRYGRLD